MFLKVMERIISNALVPFATSANIIPISQHGFLLGRSTVENLFLSLNYQTSNLNFNIPMDIVYIDFSKAFDPAPRRNLLLKLEHYGITGLLLNWITAYHWPNVFSQSRDDFLYSVKCILRSTPRTHTWAHSFTVTIFLITFQPIS